MKKDVSILIILLVVVTIGWQGCSKTEKTADKIANTMVKQPLNKAKRARLIADLGTISRAIQVFFAEKGRYPKDLKELVDNGYLQKYPVEPFGGKYIYDSTTGKVKSSTHPNYKPGINP